MIFVEDNSDNKALTLRVSGKSSVAHTIKVVSDGDAAIEYIHSLAASSANPLSAHLSSTDLKLPKLSGHEMIREFRVITNAAHIPIVVLTTSNDEGDIRTAYKCGVNSYTRKPVDFKILQNLFDVLRVYWLHFSKRTQILHYGF